MLVILANGEKPTHNIPANILKSAKKLICCDGAISFLEQQNITPHIIIGDCDSITSTQKEKYRFIIHIDKNPEYNDLQKALKHCIETGEEKVIILGAGGERDDHFLANIGILMHYANMLSLTMITNYGIFTPINCTTTFESYPGQQISIFSFSPEAAITFHGLKYPVYKQNFKELWEGSLNESVANSFTIELEKNAAFLVYAAFSLGCR
jgi:thiamine pyrophosphokinase